MRVGIWCTNMSNGGGKRLLGSLLPAIARDEDLTLVRLVISASSQYKERYSHEEYKNIEIIYYEGSIDSEYGRKLTHDVDVVYFFWPHLGFYQKVDKPTVCTFQDTTLIDFAAPPVTGTFVKEYWQRSYGWLSNMTSVVVSSEATKKAIIRLFGDYLSNAVVIPHAILPDDRNTTARSSSSLHIPKDYILCASNLSPHKNIYNLLVAYSMFDKSMDYPLVMIGDYTEKLQIQPPEWPEIPYMPTLTSLIQRKNLKLNKDIYPLGFIPDQDVIPTIKNAKALIMPSLNEGGGSYPVEEALQQGTPVLCSDIPVMREHMSRHSADIIWFNPDSPESILNSIHKLIGKYDYYKNEAIKGMNDSTETWDDVAAKYIHTFRIAYLKYHGLL
ncbi:glycosyltransferase [Pontibacillus salicampi]|uniref:Glycosyltransferase n=1 Tax=Pontibacillus salicampi TaxID=1449801 RepID=A0ABV6LQ74_9BACI